ncbi:unnamed protein product [Ilex paraguariensis]|uniref:Protein LNK1-like n=1 Tax=Ilex paraguariensis TaxID=185542 RepID=A0ABC8UKS4_9AQUA
MSDSCMYELEDIIWDEFGLSDDHIVPHPSDEQTYEHTFQGDSPKKPRREVGGVANSSGGPNAVKCVSQGKEKRDFSTLNERRNTMLENNSWSKTPDGLLPASCDNDLIKEVTSLASDNTRITSQCFKSSNVDSFGDNDLSFFDDNHGDKESSNLLYYGWPDIGNFEDVDRMFRSCDTTFGLRGVGNEDELGWFSSSDGIDGSKDVSKFTCPESSAFKNVSENHDPSTLDNLGCSINDSSMKSASVSNKYSSQLSEDDESATLSHLSFANGSVMVAKTKDQLMPKEQGVEFNGRSQFKISDTNHPKNDNSGTINKRQSKRTSPSDRKRLDLHLENGPSFHYMGHNSLGYFQSEIPYMHSDYSYPSGTSTSSPAPSGIKSENKEFTYRSSKESSNASNQVQSMESSQDPSFEGTAITLIEKKQKLHHRQGLHPSFTGNPKHVDMVVQASNCGPVSVRKQVHHSGNKFENHSDVEGVSIQISVEGSSNALESSSMSTGLEEVSLEATSFRQLQLVTEQLDLRTKLCIRDSLYRLARSAEQRHKHENLNGSCGDDRDTSGALMADGTNKCAGFMDMETDTNPIDRSVAHLLFHRPSSDSSVTPAHDALGMKSHTMIHGSITSPPVVAEKLDPMEETAKNTD